MCRGMRKRGRDILHLPNALLLFQPKARAGLGRKPQEFQRMDIFLSGHGGLEKSWQKVLAGLPFS